ncbi:MAG TPA: type II secretion system protein GspM [Nevskiaceae bacterium]
MTRAGRISARLAAGWQRVRARYAMLQPRERQVLLIAGVVVVLALVYLVAWQPVARARADAAARLDAARSTATQIARLAATAPQARGGSGARPIGGQSLLTAVDRASRGVAGLAPPSRLQPDGQDKVRVWFDRVSFDALMRWVQALQAEHGVVVDALDLSRRDDAGHVEARVTLRPA